MGLVRAYALGGGLGLACLVAMGWAAVPPGAAPGWPLLDRIGQARADVTGWYRSMPPRSGPDWDAAARAMPTGDPETGARLMVAHGCGACHRIPGIRGATGRIGPALDRLGGADGYVAGVLPNSPGGLMRWIMEPTLHSPRTAMPDLGVTEAEARHMAAYLHDTGGPVMESALDIFGSQSGLRVAGLGAASAHELTVAMTLGFGAVFVVVMALVALAWRSTAAPRGWWIWSGGVVAPLVAVVLVLFGSTFALVAITRSHDDALVIEVTGHQFWWDIVYDPEGAAIRDANQLVLPQGRPVTLRLRARDVIHSFWVPSISGKMDMVPGRINTLTVTATETGPFRGQCAEFCGLGHPRMAFELRVLDGAAFDDWLDDTGGEARDAARPELRDGREVFETAGCAACHEIRGVAEGGRLGPDLTRVGARGSLGAGDVADEPGALAGWIADARAMKPGAQMPSYTHLPGPDLRALSAWLASLK